MEKALLISHAIAGGLTLVSGLMAAFIGKKGGNLHKQVGQVFFYSMAWDIPQCTAHHKPHQVQFLFTDYCRFQFLYDLFGGQGIKDQKEPSGSMV